MKMIASRQLAARPGQVWKTLRKEGSVVITKDGMPFGIMVPTNDESLLEDLQDILHARARRAVAAIRREAARRGADRISTDDIDREIAEARKERKRR